MYKQALKIILAAEISLIFLSGCKNNDTQSITSNKETNEKYTFYPPTQFGFLILPEKKAESVNKTWIQPLQYKIINDLNFKIEELSNSEKIKLLNLTSQDIRTYFENIKLTEYVTIQDSIDFMNQMDTGLYIFDCNKLKNTICVSVAEYLDIFGLHKPEDNWISFNKLYGKYGLHYFSIPLVNSMGNKAIMIMGGANYKQGSKELLFLEKNSKEKWVVYKNVQLEII